MRKVDTSYLRAVVFGFEDSLVSTTGLVAGMAVGTSDKQVILLAGLVALAVEALSMGAGQFLTERAAHQNNPDEHDSVLTGASLMFASYLVAGLVPILPILLLPFPASIVTSVAGAIVALFVLGYAKGKVVHVAPVRSATEMAVIGGAATIIGAVVGMVLRV